jgi:acylphosphatase
MHKRLQVFFSGSVQGVGLRYTARHLAERYNIMGFVRNLRNGQVELMAEGEEQELAAFLADIEKKMTGYIRDKDVAWSEPQNQFHHFEITYE